MRPVCVSFPILISNPSSYQVDQETLGTAPTGALRSYNYFY